MQNRIFWLLLIIVGFYSCSSPQDKKYSLDIELLQNTSNTYCYLYGFLGDSQILVDSIKLENSKISYPISEKCNAGVYRLQLDSKHVDFIFNNEDISIKFNFANVPASVEVISSEENKIYYAFLKKMNGLDSVMLNQSSQIADSVLLHSMNVKNMKALISEYKNTLQAITDKQMLVYSIISSMFLIEYDAYDLLVTGKKATPQEYYTYMYFAKYAISDVRLLATPYLFQVVKNYVNQIITHNLSDKAFVSLFKISNVNEVQYFMQNYVHEYLYALKQKDVLVRFLQGNYPNQVCIDSSFSVDMPFVSQMLPAPIIPGVSYDRGDYSLLIFSDNACAYYTSILAATQKNSKALQKKKIFTYFFAKNEYQSFEQVAKVFNISAYPTMLIVDKTGVVASRFIGKEQCENTIKELIK